MDTLDRKILASLQENSGKPIADLSDRIGLSLSACARRIKNLEERGLIEGYSARLNGEALGYKMTFFVEISLDSQSDEALAAFEKAAERCSEVLECHLMTGSADYLVRVSAQDTSDYEQTYKRSIASLPHVIKIQSALVMKTIKPWHGFPI